MNGCMKGYIEKIYGADIYYEVEGRGDPLLLIHGFTGSCLDWQPFRAKWSEQFRLILPDMRGHGYSTNPLTEYSFQQVALDLLLLLDRLQIKKCKAIGCSGGGNALLHMACLQPQMIDAMVLVSATNYYPEQARALMCQTNIANMTKEEWQRLRNQHHLGDAQIYKLFEQTRSFADSYDDMNFTSEELSKIVARTLLVQGDRDIFYPIDISVEMYKSIPRCSLSIIPDAGHVPIAGDTQDYFIKMISKFLDG
ncbi:MAG: alpha/beta hydrolase fold-containing protein [Chlamydiales bacterium]|jgi:pimeloyl-ACP methyl ester carboxylesterase|nr:alpha/beta hydrolase fold-containing protein [Chlamydiales bacterium]